MFYLTISILLPFVGFRFVCFILVLLLFFLSHLCFYICFHSAFVFNFVLVSILFLFCFHVALMNRKEVFVFFFILFILWLSLSYRFRFGFVSSFLVFCWSRFVLVLLGTIQRKLAWTLRKDDTHKWTSVNKFHFISKQRMTKFAFRYLFVLVIASFPSFDLVRQSLRSVLLCSFLAVLFWIVSLCSIP